MPTTPPVLTAHDYRTPAEPGILNPFFVPQIDALTALPSGRVTLIAGPPKSGKSAVAITAAVNSHLKVAYLTFDSVGPERLSNYVMKWEHTGALGRFHYGVLSDARSLSRAMIDVKNFLGNSGSMYGVLVIDDLGYATPQDGFRKSSTTIDLQKMIGQIAFDNPLLTIVTTIGIPREQRAQPNYYNPIGAGPYCDQIIELGSDLILDPDTDALAWAIDPVLVKGKGYSLPPSPFRP